VQSESVSALGKAEPNMLQPSESQKPLNSPKTVSYAPLSGSNSPLEQATIGRSVTIKGEVSGAEALYIDGRIEGSISVPEHRVTIGRHGTIQANITAREVVVMGKVTGNIECSDRLDIRGEGTVTGDVLTQRISVEDGAVMKGSIQVRAAESKADSKVQQVKPVEQPKAMGVAAGA
jgi:cytoskeletal protein CcmA (bactofilin family)